MEMLERLHTLGLADRLFLLALYRRLRDDGDMGELLE